VTGGTRFRLVDRHPAAGTRTAAHAAPDRERIAREQLRLEQTRLIPSEQASSSYTGGTSETSILERPIRGTVEIGVGSE